MDPQPDDILRLFYGVLLPAPVQQEIAALQRRLAGSGVRVKWVEPENLHVTLKFLGELPGLAVPDLKLLGHKLAAEMPPWEVQMQGLGAFPKLSRPQTLWLSLGQGLESFAHLGKRLNQKLEDEMIAGGDTKALHPHCTLGRVRQDGGLRNLVELMQKDLDFTSQAFQCDCFQLMCSKLEPTGPTYQVVVEFHLERRG
jgi:2'-5' RNA ligase